MIFDPNRLTVLPDLETCRENVLQNFETKTQPQRKTALAKYWRDLLLHWKQGRDDSMTYALSAKDSALLMELYRVSTFKPRGFCRALELTFDHWDAEVKRIAKSDAPNVSKLYFVYVDWFEWLGSGNESFH